MQIQRYKITFFLVLAGLVLVFGSGLWLATASPASAQCGSQASSCKNCHEVQGEMPVNGDGTGWHHRTPLAIFAIICHAGNNQAQDKAEAHTGMVAPLSDVKAACHAVPSERLRGAGPGVCHDLGCGSRQRRSTSSGR